MDDWRNNAAQISRLPYPLLDLFGVKQAGQFPRALSPFYQPIIDVSELLRIDGRRLSSTATVNINAVANFNFNAAVPQDQTWYVHAFWCGTPILTAGQTLQIRSYVTEPNSNIPWINGELSNRPAVGAAGFSQLRDVWLPPGTIFGVSCNEITAGPVNGVSCQITYSAFQR